MATEMKKFLDYDGLSRLWGKIKENFATKSNTITDLRVLYDNSRKMQTIVATLADGSTTKTADIPLASADNPGLMTAEQYSIIDTLQSDIQDAAPLAGLQIKNEDGDKDDMVIDNRKTAFELKYESNAGSAYIALVDANYPATGSWRESNVDEWNAGSKGPEWTTYNDGGTDRYYVWSEAGVKGPQTSTGKPILRKPISKIDVSELLKTGLLAESDVVTYGGKTQIKLGFNVMNNGDVDVQYHYIDVTDLVEIYSPGEGISISQANDTPDDASTTTTISLNKATDSTLGGLRTGYAAPSGSERHYAVKLTAAGDAYVAVPWDTHEVSVYGGSKYVSVTPESNDESGVDGSKNHKHIFKVDVAESVQKAADLAKTAAQTISGEQNYVVANSTLLGTNSDEGKNWTIGLADGVKTSLGYANTAVQSIKSADDDAVSVSKTNNSAGQIEYTIGLGAKTLSSLGKADSAIQSLSVLGKTLNKDNNALTVDDAAKALTLGSASHINYTENIETTSSPAPWDNGISVVTVPTTQTIKTYVDNRETAITQDYGTAIENAIGLLDSSITVNSVNREDIGTAKQILTHIEIVDGKLDATKTTYTPILVQDIYDFAPLSTDDIDTICSLA